ncbi:MAG: hypothetical protein U1F52_19360 [Burkholderiales bacterium]
MGRVLSGSGAGPVSAVAGGRIGTGAWIPVLIHMFAERALGDAGWVEDDVTEDAAEAHVEVIDSLTS